MAFTFYEFFAGGGMVSAALQPGWQCLFANDFDQAKARSYVANWGDEHFHLGDVTKLTTADLPGAADMVWGSFPCQDLSLAGKGSGLAGAKSGVFWPFLWLMGRLGHEGRGPRIIALENVNGVLSSRKGADFHAICDGLAGLGYRFGAMIVDARHWVPQSRPRFFMIAVREDIALPAGLEAEVSDPAWHPKALRDRVAEMSQDMRDRWIWFAPRHPDARVHDLTDLLEDDPEDAPWRSTEETDALLSMMTEGHLEKVRKAIEDTRASGGRVAGGLYRRTRNKVQRAEVRFDGVAGCLRTPGGGSSRQSLLVIDRGQVRSRLLSKREAARLMGLPDDYVLPEPYNEAYHLAGDGVAVPAVDFLRREIMEPILIAAEAAQKEKLMPQRPTLDQLADLARETEMQAPIDWGMLRVDEDGAYRMMASQVLELLDKVPPAQRETVMMATMTHLLVENFVLQSQRLGGEVS